MKTIIMPLFYLLLLSTCPAQQITIDSSHLWKNPPDSIPKIFGQGILSVQDRYEYGLSISPNYDEIFFTVSQPGDGLMVMKKLENGSWSFPELANLRRDKSWEQEAFFTQDGKKLFFSSDVNDTTRLWFSLKEKSGWSAAELLDSPVNNNWVFWATFTNSGTMYYTNINAMKIYKSDFVDNNFKEAIFSGIRFGMHPSVSKDEKFILLDYKGDIYVSYKSNDDKWTDPVKLGEQINTSFAETCPTLSPDEKFIFFSRYIDDNGKSDIYWVSSRDIINIRI